MHTLKYASELLALAASSMAVNLYVSSYDGNITSLDLTQNYYGSYVLTATSVTITSAPDPSWLTIDSKNRILYATNEAWGLPNGTITSYNISDSGQFVGIDHHEMIAGPVNSAFYNNGKALAVAH